MEKQVLHRVDGGSLSEEEIEAQILQGLAGCDAFAFDQIRRGVDSDKAIHTARIEGSGFMEFLFFRHRPCDLPTVRG